MSSQKLIMVKLRILDLIFSVGGKEDNDATGGVLERLTLSLAEEDER